MRHAVSKIRDSLRVTCLGVLCLIGAVAQAEADRLVFDGWVEAVHQGDVHSRVDGVVAEVMATQGTYVEAGTPLVRLRQDIAGLQLDAARARVAQAEVLLAQAQGRLARAERLSASGSGSDVALIEAQTHLALTKAGLEAERAEMALAQVALDDTVIRAPIAGYVEDPRVRVGALVEFNSGDAPLFQIVGLDPVRVVYEVPYTERLSQVARSGAADSDALLSRVRFAIATPEGEILKSDLTPEATAVWVDPDTGTLRVWATVENADLLLRPGMEIRVLSNIGPVQTSVSQ